MISPLQTRCLFLSVLFPFCFPCRWFSFSLLYRLIFLFSFFLYHYWRAPSPSTFMRYHLRLSCTRVCASARECTPRMKMCSARKYMHERGSPLSREGYRRNTNLCKVRVRWIKKDGVLGNGKRKREQEINEEGRTYEQWQKKKKKEKRNKRRSNKMEVNLNERDRTVMKVDEGRWRRIEGREEKSPCERSTVFEIVYDCAVQRALPFSAFSFLPAAHGRSDYAAYTALIRFLLVLFIFFFFFLYLEEPRGYQWSMVR